MVSLMNKFNNPRSSSSSEQNRQGLRLHSSSYDSKSMTSDKEGQRHHSSNENLFGNLTQKEVTYNPYKTTLAINPNSRRNPTDSIIQVQETKFISQDGTSQRIHDSEMVDAPKEAQLITKDVSEIRVIRSSLSSAIPTQNKIPKFKDVIDIIGKETRSRNVVGQIQASLQSSMSGSHQMMSAEKRIGKIAINYNNDDDLEN